MLPCKVAKSPVLSVGRRHGGQSCPRPRGGPLADHAEHLIAFPVFALPSSPPRERGSSSSSSSSIGRIHIVREARISRVRMHQYMLFATAVVDIKTLEPHCSHRFSSPAFAISLSGCSIGIVPLGYVRNEKHSRRSAFLGERMSHHFKASTLHPRDESAMSFRSRAGRHH